MILADVVHFLAQLDERWERYDRWGEEAQQTYRAVLAFLLGLLPPASRLGTELVNSIWRQVPMTAVEVPVFRQTADGPAVWLARRKADEAYPGLLHCPGTLVWAEDRDLQATVARLGRREYGSEDAIRLLVDRPLEIVVAQEERGTMVSLLFVGYLTNDPPAEVGSWFLVADTATIGDDEIVPDHRDRLIPTAYQVWLRPGG